MTDAGDNWHLIRCSLVLCSAIVTVQAACTCSPVGSKTTASMPVASSPVIKGIELTQAEAIAGTLEFKPVGLTYRERPLPRNMEQSVSVSSAILRGDQLPKDLRDRMPGAKNTLVFRIQEKAGRAILWLDGDLNVAGRHYAVTMFDSDSRPAFHGTKYFVVPDVTDLPSDASVTITLDRFATK